MPANRDKLHHTKVDEFAEWAAAAHAYWREPTKGVYEALRIRKGYDLLVFYRRSGTDHLTVSSGVQDQLVRKWLRTRKAGL